jgi:molybdopterin molybdotransferase
MISVTEAQLIIDKHVKDFGIETISLHDSVGRVLRSPIICDRDLPPYDRVTMDGIAIRFEDYAAGVRSFNVKGVAAAGSPKQVLEEENSCLEVMTGAIMPGGVDTVIRYEDVKIENGIATIDTVDISHKQNIHFKGSDRVKGTAVVKQGQIISQAEIGVAASTGNDQLKVSRLPRIVVISTGDELVDVEQTPLAYQIRKSNVHMISSLLRGWGGQVELKHLVDDFETIKEKLSALLPVVDCIILSGGVSKGKFDFLPKVLEELGVTKHFHKIRQRPGKPFWFGTLSDETIVFALPGNPVSSFMCAIRYIQPWMRKSIQTPVINQTAELAADISFKPDLTYFPIVNIRSSDDGKLLAYPVNNNGSGDFASLTDGNAFLELTAGQNIYYKGGIYTAHFYRGFS